MAKYTIIQSKGNCVLSFLVNLGITKSYMSFKKQNGKSKDYKCSINNPWVNLNKKKTKKSKSFISTVCDFMHC